MKTNATGIQGTARTWHQTVRVVATANSAASGLLTIDGIALATGDRVLLTAQTSGVDNGVYVAASGTWTRAVDMLVGSTVEPTAHVPVSEGTSNADSTYQLTTDGSIIAGTTSMTFAKIAGGGGGGGAVGGAGEIQWSDGAAAFQADPDFVWSTGTTQLELGMFSGADARIQGAGDVVIEAMNNKQIVLQTSSPGSISLEGDVQCTQGQFNGRLPLLAVSVFVDPDTGFGLTYTMSAASDSLNRIVHIVNSTGNPVALLLPAAASCPAGSWFQFKDGGGNAAANTITINGTGVGGIDGGSIASLSQDYAAVGVYSDGSNWFIAP